MMGSDKTSDSLRRHTWLPRPGTLFIFVLLVIVAPYVGVFGWSVHKRAAVNRLFDELRSPAGPERLEPASPVWLHDAVCDIAWR